MDNLGASNFVLTFLLGGTILLGLFIILILLRAKRLGISRYFLAALLFFLILHLDTFLLFTTQIIRTYPNLLGISFPSLFLLGPAYYFFMRSFGNTTFKLKSSHALHLIPFLCALWIQASFYIRSIDYKRRVIAYYYTHVPNERSTLYEWVSANAFILLFLMYIIIAIKGKHEWINGNGSVLKRISRILLLLCLAYLLLQTGFLVTGVSAIVAEIVLACAMAIAILVLGYLIVDIKHVFSTSRSTSKYKTSPLSHAQLAHIESSLRNALVKDRLYLDPKLKVKDLSKAIDIPADHISQVLNEKMSVSFYDFINDYRVEEVKKLLENGIANKLSIQAIGEESGFSNKTSFYRAFKKFTGQTPNAYMKRYNMSSDL